MPIQLARGTKEKIDVLVIDNSATPLTDLTGHSPRFDVNDPVGGHVYTNQAASNTTMTIECLIDTTLSGFATDGQYLLWVQFDYTPESPKLGPIPFYVGP